MSQDLARSSMSTANYIGNKTGPCRTPKLKNRLCAVVNFQPDESIQRGYVQRKYYVFTMARCLSRANIHCVFKH